MPRFNFTCGKCGTKSKHEGGLEKCPACGHQLPKRDWAEGAPASIPSSRLRVESDSMSVHPEQIEEAIADAHRRGVRIDFDPDGTARFQSRHQRNKYLKAYHFHDKDAGFSDPTPP